MKDMVLRRQVYLWPGMAGRAHASKVMWWASGLKGGSTLWSVRLQVEPRKEVSLKDLVEG